MLIALALGGLAAAFAAPILLSSEDDGEDIVSPGPDSEDVSEPDDLAGVGQMFEMSLSVGEFEIEDFDPEVDECLLHVDDIDAMIEAGVDANGASFLRTETSEGDMVITFAGLDEVPSDAVHFVVPDGEGGSTSLSLTEVLERGVEDPVAASLVEGQLDGGEEPDFSAFDGTRDDIADALLVLPEIGVVADDSFDLLDELVPLTPVDGDVADQPTTAVDDTAAIAPVDGDTPGTPSDPLGGIVPLSPVTDDLEEAV